MHWLFIEDASRTTETEQAISQGGDVRSPSSGDPPLHGSRDMTPDTQLSPGFADVTPDTQPSPGVAAMRADTRPSPGVAAMRADTHPSPGVAAMRADTQPSPGVAVTRADTQPRELDSVGQSLCSLQLVEHSTVCDQSTVAVAEQKAPTTATCPVSTVTVTSSMAKLHRAMSNWCTPATWAYLQGDDKVGEGGGRGEEKLEPPFLPAVHSVGQAQLQRNIFMQQLKRKSVNHDILVCMNQNDVFNILLSFSLSEIDGYLTGVTTHQVLPALTELVRTFK